MSNSCKKSDSERCRGTISHINRIIGQLTSLKRHIEEDKPCEQIASLATSISKSCDGLRTRTLEGFILNDVLDTPLPEKKKELLIELLNRYKK